MVLRTGCTVQFFQLLSFWPKKFTNSPNRKTESIQWDVSNFQLFGQNAILNYVGGTRTHARTHAHTQMLEGSQVNIA